MDLWDFRQFALGMALAFICNVLPAGAQTEESRIAREMTDRARENSERFYKRYPKLLAVDAAIRQDCAKNHNGETRDGAFCSCAAVITMDLWRSGIDPRMVPRLKKYIRAADASADSFLAYQGPELYGPLCHLTTGH